MDKKDRPSLSKSEFADLCGVNLKKFAKWCNVDYYEELIKLGYKKNQKIFTPCQTEFLKKNIVEYFEC